MKTAINLIKILAVNVLVLVSIIILIEIGAGVVRIGFGKDFRLPLLAGNTYQTLRLDDPRHPCAEMKTDVLLNHVPYHKDSCRPLGGRVYGEYVLYDISSTDKPIMLTLGDSTTSGFYQHISDGETYPKVLASLAKDDFFVVNGGVGAYSSLQEFYKFVRDGSRFENLKVVISLNGINDLPNYHALPGQQHRERQRSKKIREHDYPFMTHIQYSMNSRQMWIDQRYWHFSSIFPNFFSLFNNVVERAKRKKFNTDIDYSIEAAEGIFNAVSAVERWEKNVTRLQRLVELESAKYFVFLQPNLALEGVQSKAPPGTKDAEILATIEADYIIEIQKLYRELKSRCRRLAFCFDISDSVPPTGNVYNDRRHHNAEGNKLLAKKIWSIVSENL
jgi:lysophospholipase L1-like esterase